MRRHLLWLLIPTVVWATEDDTWNPSSDFGGHSREFRSISEPVDWDSLLRIPGDNVRRPRAATETQATDEEIRDFISSHMNSYYSAIGYFKELMKNEWVSISSRIKSFSSLKEKVQRKKYPLERIRDVIGIRLTFQKTDDVRKAKAIIEVNGTKQFSIHEVRCYGICENATMNYTENGYRRIHLLVKIHPELKWAEIQLATPYTNVWSDWNHDFLYKGIFSKTDQTDMNQYVIDVADYLLKLDEVRNNLPLCPPILHNTKAQDAMTKLSYEYLHKPPNLCFHWNDLFLSQPVIQKNDSDNQNIASNKAFTITVLPWMFILLFI